MKKQKRFGERTPYAWVLELVRGCNLSCAHCSCRLDMLPKTYQYMSIKTAKQTARIIAAVNPTARLDLCGLGENTLHPNLIQIIKIIRRAAPQIQIQITTNGTEIAAGRVHCKDLLDAGVNFIYIDMYSPVEKFRQLMPFTKAQQWYEYYNAPKDALSPWKFHGNPRLRVIVLQENPSHWPKSRHRANLLGTWFNHVDWEAAKKFNMTPVLNAPNRRCNQPFVYAQIDVNGDYLLCCQDGAHETAGHLGNVSTGLEGFKEFWFGPFMQRVRYNLRDKNRSRNPHCCRCCITFSRCDYILWKNDNFKRWYGNGKWHLFTKEDRMKYKRRVRMLKKSIGPNGLPSKPWPKYKINP